MLDKISPRAAYSRKYGILEKWFPLQGERGHSSYFWSFQKQNREEGVTEQNQQAYQFTQGYNILARTKSTPPNSNLYHTQ